MPQQTAFIENQIELLLNDVFEQYGYDFTGYSRASLKRRVMRLFALDKFNNFIEFRYRISRDPNYFKRFIEQLTVNVTEMFRDPEFYKTLRNAVLPQFSSASFIRIWLAGCSTGEEAYSMAILLKEMQLLSKSLIYATDINPSVLEKAAQAMFPLSNMKQYSENYIASGGMNDFSSYYHASYSLAKFNEELRSKIIFSTHNLASDHSFNEFQLILCRNVLIYFDRGLQFNVLKLFDQSLSPQGYLALGSKETIAFSSIAHRYTRLNREKIWRKIDEHV